MTRLHLIILRLGACLLPENERAEWLAEWMTELWYAIREGRRAGLTAFCFGSWHDARWKRRHAPVARYGFLLLNPRRCAPEPPLIPCAPFLESPGRCLGVLGGLAALAFLLNRLYPLSPLSGGQVLLCLLLFSAFYTPIAALTSNTPPGEYPRHRDWARRCSFYLAKLALLAPAIAFGTSVMRANALRLDVAIVCTAIAVHWAVMDQRRRCPACLRILDHPVRMGSHSRILLEWNGTELLCPRGHGVMHVPEEPAIWFSRQRWLPLT
jgi:hypothetical protein